MKLIRQRRVLDPERRAMLSLRFVPASGALVDIAFGLELMHFRELLRIAYFCSLRTNKGLVTMVHNLRNITIATKYSVVPPIELPLAM